MKLGQDLKHDASLQAIQAESFSTLNFKFHYFNFSNLDLYVFYYFSGIIFKKKLKKVTNIFVEFSES